MFSTVLSLIRHSLFISHWKSKFDFNLQLTLSVLCVPCLKMWGQYLNDSSLVCVIGWIRREAKTLESSMLKLVVERVFQKSLQKKKSYLWVLWRPSWQRKLFQQSFLYLHCFTTTTTKNHHKFYLPRAPQTFQEHEIVMFLPSGPRGTQRAEWIIPEKKELGRSAFQLYSIAPQNRKYC